MSFFIIISFCYFEIKGTAHRNSKNDKLKDNEALSLIGQCNNFSNNDNF